jgi:hypothetical protein
MDPFPEWTTQTRKVTRPEDIVINRDSELERGELETRSTCHPLPYPERNDTVSSNEKNEKVGGPRTDNQVPPTEMNLNQQGEGEHPSSVHESDEDETIEWQEGDNTVLEHHVPGEEEVKKTYYFIGNHRSHSLPNRCKWKFCETTPIKGTETRKRRQKGGLNMLRDETPTVRPRKQVKTYWMTIRLH